MTRESVATLSQVERSKMGLTSFLRLSPNQSSARSWTTSSGLRSYRWRRTSWTRSWVFEIRARRPPEVFKRSLSEVASQREWSDRTVLKRVRVPGVRSWQAKRKVIRKLSSLELDSE